MHSMTSSISLESEGHDRATKEVSVVDDPERLHQVLKPSSSLEDTGDVNSSPHTPELPPPPDGGMWAWLQVVAAFLANFNSWGIVNAFGVYQQYYQETLLKNHSPFQISWIVALSGALLVFGTNLFGGIVDLGYIKHMAFASCLLQFAALMLLSWSKTYAEIILTQGLFVGIVSSMLFIMTIAAVAPYFSTKRPFAIGVGAAGSAIGGTLYSSIARKLITEVGFGWSTRIIAFIELATTAVMFLCIRRRLPPSPRRVFFAFECFREPAFMLYCLGNIFSFIGLYTFYVYYETYALSVSPHENSYMYMTAIVNAGAVLGRIIPSLAANYIGPVNVLVPCEAVAMILSFCWMVAKSKGAIIVVGILFGMFSGAILAMPGAIVAVLTADFSRLGIRLSFAFTFVSFGIVLGPPLSGIIQRKYGWFWLELYASLALLCGLLCHIALRFVATGPRLAAKA